MENNLHLLVVSLVCIKSIDSRDYANMILIDICVYNTKEWRKAASLEDGHYDVSVYTLESWRRSCDL